MNKLNLSLTEADISEVVRDWGLQEHIEGHKVSQVAWTGGLTVKGWLDI